MIRSGSDLISFMYYNKLLVLGLLLGFLFNSFFFYLCHADPSHSCLNSSSYVGFESKFTMVQHQLRGLVTIIDDCSFRVSQFDMLSGSDVHWWGAVSSNFVKMTNGFVVSDHKVNETYKNASFVVRLNENVTWDQIQVLAVWDLPASSDFGHIILTNESASSPTLSPVRAPSSDNGTTLEEGEVWNLMAPTMFDNCKVLSKSYRIRWSLNSKDNFIDIGLEAATGIQNYMAFGWARPGSDAELMQGADVAVTGFTEEGKAFADDFFINQYSECTINKDGCMLTPASAYFQAPILQIRV